MSNFPQLHPSSATHPARNRSWIALVSSLLLLAVILFVVTREDSLAALLDVWGRAKTGPFVLAVLTMIALQAVVAWRLKVIMGADGVDQISVWPLFRIQLVSQFAANGAPISALSDLARAALVKLRFGLGAGRSIRLILYDRIFGAFGAIVFGIFAALFQRLTPISPALVKTKMFIRGAGCVGIAVLVAIADWHINTGVELIDRVARAITGLGHILRRPAIAVKLLLAQSVLLLCFAVAFIALANGMQIQVSPLLILLFTPLIFFVSVLPIFYQGWGGREAIVVATIGTAGHLTSTEAIALSVAFGVAMLLASLPGAVLWIMRPSMRAAVRMDVE